MRYLNSILELKERHAFLPLCYDRASKKRKTFAFDSAKRRAIKPDNFQTRVSLALRASMAVTNVIVHLKTILCMYLIMDKDVIHHVDLLYCEVLASCLALPVTTSNSSNNRGSLVVAALRKASCFGYV